jgi:phospholipid/cholesterol/gamma-HCH transport system substrate-binding protein
LFMVLGIVILYFGFNFLKGIDFFSRNNKYFVIYDNINGLNVSNPIFINGFAVGRVSKISLIQEYDEVMVELDIKGDIILGDSSTATLNSDFLGNKSILISIGDISKPLEDGDTLIAVLDKGIAELLAESAQPVANNLESTIKKINAILDNLSGNSGKINQIIDRLERTTVLLNATIGETKQNLNRVTGTFERVGGTLENTLLSAQPTLDNLEIVTDSLKNLELNKSVAKANKALDNLNAAIEKFAESEGTIGKLINDDSLYVNLNDAVESLDALLEHLNQNPKHFLAPLGKSAKKIERDQRKAAKREEREANKEE